MTSRNAARRWWLAVVIVAIVGVVGVAIRSTVEAEGFILNRTPSMPIGIYRRVGTPISRGGIVAFCPPPAAVAYQRRWHPEGAVGGGCPEDQPIYVKYAVALPGDRIAVRADGIHVNGGPALRGSRPLLRIRDERGSRRLPDIVGRSFVIGPGETWAWTPEWYSFDSRYYGPVVGATAARAIIVDHETPQSAMPAAVERMQDGQR